MAVLDSVPGVEVTIRVNGETAREYEDPNTIDTTAEKTVTRYIECIDNSEFSVFAQAHKSYAWGYKNHSLLISLYIDGKYVGGIYILPERDEKFCHIEGVCSGKSSEVNWTLRKFTFSAIQIGENAPVEVTKKSSKKHKAKDFGIIEAKITRRVKGDKRAKETSMVAKKPKGELLNLTEKSLKGQSISHGTTFSKTAQVERPDFLTTKPIPEDNGPIATYRFIYRSKEALKNELIIPRSPSPDPLLGLSLEEVQRLARERINMPASVKTEVAVKREHEPVDLTSEDYSTTRKKARYESPIDLTDD